MTERKDLLIEIGTEELPPKALLKLSRALEEGVLRQLSEHQLAYGDVQSFSTPRRLALRVRQLEVAQQDQAVTRKGPSLKAAFDAEGKPTRAALGFAQSCGVGLEDLRREEGAKGAWLVFRRLRPGRSAESLVPEILRQAIAELPIPKRMRWGNGDVEFVRPVHWVLLLFGEHPIAATILGLTGGNTTRGHRFHHPRTIEIPSADSYEEHLRAEGRVEADFVLRREKIREQLVGLGMLADGHTRIDEELLEEVTALTEWPVAVLGSFDAKFLEVPSEVLIETMQKNQKYFPILGDDDALLPYFITVSNIESHKPQEVRAGNERVIRPRFNDAAFFWEQDLNRPLEQLCGELESVVFQERLGTLAEKSRRIADCAGAFAEMLGLDPALSRRAGAICKCDLVTQMVVEFPGLQGIMGRYYALHAGEDSCVAAAMAEHYLPRHAGDRLPETDCGRLVGLADRLDSLVGIFAIGQKPTGVKDPFALRRSALGVLRIVIETPFDLDLMALLTRSAAVLATKLEISGVARAVFDYTMERLKSYYADQGIGTDTVDSVLACRVTRPADLDRRVRAVSAFRRLPEAASLAAANKRIRNILRKTEEPFPKTPDAQWLREPAEKALAKRVEMVSQAIRPLLNNGEYDLALTELAQLREPLDDFFDQVMVMCDEQPIRLNRLALLGSLSALFLGVADVSRLQG